MKKLYEVFPPALDTGVKVVECEYQPERFYDAVGVREEPELANEPEKGERCRRCYKFRLERAAAYAATTATVTETLEKSPKWLFSDFKKRVASNATSNSAKNMVCTARTTAALFIYSSFISKV